MSDEAAIQVFNQLRTTRMNVRYHETRLEQLNRTTFWIDLFTLVAVAVIGVGVWEKPTNLYADYAVKFFTVVATLVAGYGLLKKPGECAARCEAHLAVREQQYKGLMILVRRINSQGWSASITKEMETICAAAEGVHLARFEATEKSKLVDDAYDLVDEELPASFLQLGSTCND